jgi:hypothetical protein
MIKFNGVTIQNVNIYRSAIGNGEKIVSGVQAKLTPSQKEAIRQICHENGLDMSAFARDAITAYLDLFPYKEKIERHRRLLREILHRLS